MTLFVDCLLIGDIFLDFNIKLDISSIVRGGITYCDHKGIKRCFGGSGNIASALALLGIKSYFVGKAGNDGLGNQYREDLEKSNVGTKIFFHRYMPTGIVFSIVGDDMERSFIVARGANDTLTIEEVKQAIGDIDFEFMYVTGYSLVNSPQRDSIVYAVRSARQRNNTRIFFDIGAFNIIDGNRCYFEEILELSDIVSANASEAKALLKVDTINDYTAEALSRKGSPSCVIVRLGKDGCIVSCSGQQQIHANASATQTMDTTGAGDAFNAAFICGLKRRWPLRDAANFASWFAARTTEKLGARSFPQSSEIRSMVKSIEGR
jgi:ribokinase